MTLVEFLALLIAAGICGAMGQVLSGYSLGGCLVSIVIGFFGALLGIWIARMLDLPEWLPLRIGATRFPIIWATIGSVVFVGTIGLLSHARRRF